MFTTSKRDAKFELVRIFATVLVISYYVARAFPSNDAMDHSGICHTIFSVVNELAAPLFLLLSGRFALTLDFSKTSLKEFYFKKMAFILIPLFCIMLAHYYLDFIATANEFNFFNFLPFAAAAFNNLHYWFMYNVTFYILLAPVLSLAFKDISDRAVISFFAIGIIYSICSYYVPLVPEAKFSYANQFGNLMFYFFLGGMSDKLTEIIGKNKLYIAGAVSFPIIVMQTKWLGTYGERYDISPFFIFFALAVYTLLTSLYKDGNKVSNTALTFVGKYTFLMCMIQGIIMKRLVEYGILPTDKFWLFVCAGTAAMFALTFVSSVILDTVVFRFVRIGLYHICRGFNNIK